MAANEIEHKKRLVQLANAIRRKYETVKRGEDRFRRKMERKFQPLLNRIQSPSQTTTQSMSKVDAENLKVEDAKVESRNFSNNTSDEDIAEDALISDDSTFGLTRKRGCYYLGNVPVQLHKNVLTIESDKYPLTPGLLSLLTRKAPMGYTEDDLHTYKNMLVQTNAHRTVSGNIRSKKSHKYKTVVRHLFATPTNQTSGEGLREMKYIRGVGTEYIYWDDINELVERLYLLHSSLKAGNTSPVVKNEILNIEEELREANIIE